MVSLINYYNNIVCKDENKKFSFGLHNNYNSTCRVIVGCNQNSWNMWVFIIFHNGLRIFGEIHKSCEF